MLSSTLPYRNGLREFLKTEKKKDEKSDVKLPPIDASHTLLSDKKQRNPFVLPSANSWINAWKAEKETQNEIRKTERKCKVHLKHTFSTRSAYSTLPAIRQMCKNIDMEEAARMKKDSESVLKTTRKLQVRPVEREFTHDFIQKKRNIFLMEFALQTKRHEVEKFKALALAGEKEVIRQMNRLHEDAVLFDDFLKATDDAAVEAMKIAERETRLKLERVAEFKKCSSRMTALKSEISKKDEILTEYLNCKIFLTRVHENALRKDSLPIGTDEWSARREAERIKLLQSRAASRKSTTDSKQKDKFLSRRNTFRRASRKAPTEERAISRVDSKQAFSKIMFPEEWDHDVPSARQQGKGNRRANANAEEPNSAPRPSVDDVPAVLPFENPKQLLDIIHDLEEKNLKLIYKYQQTEEELEDMKNSAQSVKKRLIAETKVLSGHVRDIRDNISNCENKANELSVMCTILSGGSRERDSKQALAELTVNVAKVYKSVFSQSIVTVDALVMLTCLEYQMDELLEEVDSIHPDKVQEVQKTIDKERRMQLREEKMAIQRLKQEERAKKATERANAVSFKRTGRRLMFRSIPPRIKVQEERKLSIRTKSVESFDFFSRE
ncbi:cilia- and flagella-associated protein 100-like [Styela clava]